MTTAFTCLRSSGDILTTPSGLQDTVGFSQKRAGGRHKTPSTGQSVTRTVWALSPIYNDKYSFYLAIGALYSMRIFHLILGIPAKVSSMPDQHFLRLQFHEPVESGNKVRLQIKTPKGSLNGS